MFALSTTQLVTTAGSALVLWLVKRRFVNSIRNPLARTVVSIVDRTAIGMPVVLLVATADLAITTANGVLQSLLAGGYVIKIVSTGVVDVCADALREREEQRHRNSLLDSWVRLDASSDSLDLESFEGCEFAVLDAPALSSTSSSSVLSAQQLEPSASISLDTLEAVRASLLADPSASVCVVPVASSNSSGGDSGDAPLELALSKEDAARLLAVMAQQRRSSDAAAAAAAASSSSSAAAAAPPTLSMMSSSVIL